MYDHKQHRGRKNFLEAFSTSKILKIHVNDCFKGNDKKSSLRYIKR